MAAVAAAANTTPAAKVDKSFIRSTFMGILQNITPVWVRCTERGTIFKLVAYNQIDISKKIKSTHQGHAVLAQLRHKLFNFGIDQVRMCHRPHMAYT